MTASVCIISSFLLLFSVLSVNCLYEDQAGTYDWHAQFIGKPKLLKYIDNGDSIEKIIIGTEENVLSKINGKDGVLAWRHVYEKSNFGRIDDVKLFGQRVVAVFGGGHRVQLIQSSLGIIEWDTHISNSDPSYPATLIIDSLSIGVVTSKELAILSLESGRLESTYALKQGEVVGVWNQAAGKIVVVTVNPSNVVTITTYSNSQVSSKELPLWANKPKCRVTKGGCVVCIDEENNKIYSTSASSSKPFNAQILPVKMKDANFVDFDTSLGSTIDLIAVRVNSNTIQLFANKDGTLESKFTFNEALAVQTFAHEGQLVIATLKRISNEKLQLQVFGLQSTQEIFTQHFHLQDHHGDPLKMHGVRLELDQKGRQVFSALLLCEDHSIVYVLQSGKRSWTREESLSEIQCSQIVDLPISQAQAELKQEFTSGENVLGMFLKRITSQLHQLKAFIENLKTTLKQLIQPSHHHHHHHHYQHQAVEEDEDDENEEDDDDDENDGAGEFTLKRDEFNLNKMIVVATSVGKLYGIDSSSGKTIWKIMIKQLKALEHTKMFLYVQRTSNNFPHAPVCTLIAINKETSKNILFSFNPITGKEVILSAAASSSSSSSLVDGTHLDYQLDNVVLLEHVDDDLVHPLILFDLHHHARVYPPTSENFVAKMSSSIYTFSVESTNNIATGYKLVIRDNKLLRTPTWTLNLPKNQKIVNVYPKHPAEQVHSVGLALEDRSVLYKYLDPNLVVLLAQDDRDQAKSSFSIYLLDAVSGNVIFQCVHKRSSGKVHVLHSENWVVYNYWNQKHRRNEIAVLELYEGNQQSNSTAFSSLYPPPLPRVLKQSYIFGAHISTMAVSLTEKGIASKEILVGLETGGIIGLPKMLVDARRPEVVTQENREEGLYPYMPELPRPWDRMLTYHLATRNLRTITTSPSGLESTSLVFCYGLDMFYTRVMPSKMFDVLKEDFDYFFISAVLAGMILTSLLTQKLAANKLLNRAWK